MNFIIVTICAALGMFVTVGILQLLVGLAIFLLLIAAIIISLIAVNTGHMGAGEAALVSTLCGVVAGIISFPLIPHLMTMVGKEKKGVENDLVKIKAELENMKKFITNSFSNNIDSSKDITEELNIRECIGCKKPLVAGKIFGKTNYCIDCGDKLGVEIEIKKDNILCTNCGKENDPSVSFCNQCGQKILLEG